MRETCEDIIVNKALNFPRMMKQKSNPLLHTMMKKQRNSFTNRTLKNNLHFISPVSNHFFFFCHFLWQAITSLDFQTLKVI